MIDADHIADVEATALPFVDLAMALGIRDRESAALLEAEARKRFGQRAARARHDRDDVRGQVFKALDERTHPMLTKDDLAYYAGRCVVRYQHGKLIEGICQSRALHHMRAYFKAKPHRLRELLNP